jgi:hypothetical protein
MPQYIALIHHAADTADLPDISPKDWAAQMALYGEFGATAGSKIVGGNALQGTHTATVVRVEGGKGGKVVLTDGPFGEAKEAIGGYYVLECADLDEALAVAAQIPGAWLGRGVEVRPCLEM